MVLEIFPFLMTVLNIIDEDRNVQTPKSATRWRDHKSISQSAKVRAGDVIYKYYTMMMPCFIYFIVFCAIDALNFLFLIQLHVDVSPTSLQLFEF